MSDFTAAVQRAVAAHQQGRLAEAEALYRQILQARPGHPQVNGFLGVLLCQKGPQSQDAGLTLLRNATKIAPNDAQIRNNLASALQMAGRNDEAIEIFQNALKEEPNNLAAAQSLSALYHQIERPADAVKLCREMLARRDDPVLRYNLATSLNQIGELDEAEDELKKVVAKAPEVAEAWGNLGAIQTRRGKIDAALQTYGRALKRFPKAVAFQIGIGNAHYRVKDWAAAEAAFKAALEIGPDQPAAHAGLINSLLRQGDNAGAVAAAETASRLPNAPTDLLCALGEAFEAAERSREALTIYKEVLKKSPLSVRAVSRIGPLARLAGEDGLAESYFDLDHILYRESVAAPPEGYDSLADFNSALADYIYQRRDHVENALDTTTRGGSQTAELFNDDAPVVGASQKMAEAAAGRFLRQLRMGGRTGYFRGAPNDWKLISNAVVLRSSGYQDPHIHINGYLSGVYYLKIPPEMGEGKQEGCIFFSL